MSDRLFLEILKTALRGGKMPCDTKISCEDMDEIIRLAELHKVLPMIFDSVYPVCPYDEATQEALRRRVRLIVMQQTLRTQRFLELYKKLQLDGLEPVVVKGIICRSLYPAPDFRPSADEDLFIFPKDSELYEKALAESGFRQQEKRSESYYETSYFSDDGFHLEVHTSLFSTEIEYFDVFNIVFDGAQNRAVYTQLDSVNIRTLSPTDNLLFLILHSLKHFVHSGVGIRQVCDIILFAESFGEDIDWTRVVSVLKGLGAENYTAGLFGIGERHLGLDVNKSRYPQELQGLCTDDEILLRDILCAGIYGGSTMSRRHSGGITLSAVQGDKNSLAHRLFPSGKSLDSRFEYAKKNPLLLPVAWVHRLMKYMTEVDKSSENTPAESLRTGRERIELLRGLGLLPE